MGECGITELESRGKLHTDDVTFELVQRRILSLRRLEEGHMRSVADPLTSLQPISMHIGPTYNSSHGHLFA